MSGVKPIINTLSRAYILPDDKGFAPPIICIDFREYEAMKSELIELRAFKVNHSATFDAPTEYGPDWKAIVDEGKTIKCESGWQVKKVADKYHHIAPFHDVPVKTEDWKFIQELMSSSRGWRIKE